jgi:hypothetical protein
MHYTHGTRPMINMFVPLNLPQLGIKQNLYMIDYYGDILNINTGKILSQAISDLSGFGYRYAGLQMEDGSRQTFTIHRLVALTFIGKTEEDINLERDTVNHIEGYVDDNCYTQLEWTTSQENSIHAVENETWRVKPMVTISTNGNWSRGDLTAGQNNGCSRLTDNQVHIICQSVQDGCDYKTAAINAGLEGNENDRFLISHIVQGTRWPSISSQYNLKQQRTMADFSKYVIPACELLESGQFKNNIEIARYIINQNPEEDFNLVNLTGLVCRIKNKKSHTDISCNYNF